MIDFTNRSLQKELLDAADIPFAAIEQNMQELNNVNKLLGGHAITLQGFRKLVQHRDGPVSICEIGCGGGDNLRVLYNYAKKKNLAVQITGIDIKPECIRFASSRNKDMQASWVCSDYREADMNAIAPDIIFSSLFCHHFPGEALVGMMQWMQQHSKLGFFINDLHRHPVAYHAIRLLTRLFSQSYLVKHDAPLSVARGFRIVEWKSILADAGLSSATVHWKWAFRHLVTYKK